MRFIARLRDRVASCSWFGPLLVAACCLGPFFSSSAAEGAEKKTETSKAAAKKVPHIVFVTGDDEYRSEITMPLMAKILEKHHGMKVSIAYAVDPATGKKNPKFKSNIEGLDALKTADLAVFYLRFRVLPDDQLKKILDYVNSGRPVIGFRTATHSFLYPKGENTKYNNGFGTDVLGQRWITHHGHQSSTLVKQVPEQKSHPILNGVDATFTCRSWLYHVAPLVGDCQVLLNGTSIDSNKTKDPKYPLVQPVAWTKTYKGAKVFTTTLGHPKDFENLAMRRLVVNAVYWSLGKPIPAGGTKADVVGKYIAPPTH